MTIKYVNICFTCSGYIASDNANSLLFNNRRFNFVITKSPLLSLVLSQGTYF